MAKIASPNSELEHELEYTQNSVSMRSTSMTWYLPGRCINPGLIDLDSDDSPSRWLDKTTKTRNTDIPSWAREEKQLDVF